MTTPSPGPSVTQLTDVRLVPVVEMQPSRYDRVANPRPEDSGAPTGQELERAVSLGLTDVGIDVEPLSPGGWLVPVSRLTAPDVLRKLLRVELGDFGQAGAAGKALERVSAIEGGQALLDGEDLILTPRCCGALKDLRSWEDAARLKLRGFWMGHPQVFAAWEEPWLVLREEEPDRDGIRRGYRLSPLALARAVLEARMAQEGFAHRLVPFLSEQFPAELARTLAWHLAGLTQPSASP